MDMLEDSVDASQTDDTYEMLSLTFVSRKHIIDTNMCSGIYTYDLKISLW